MCQNKFSISWRTGRTMPPVQPPDETAWHTVVQHVPTDKKASKPMLHFSKPANNGEPTDVDIEFIWDEDPAADT